MVFDIPAQPLDLALLQYSRQAGVQVISSSSLLANKVSPQLHGSETPRNALSTLLRGTNLSFTVAGENTVAITTLPASGPSAHSAQVLPATLQGEPPVPSPASAPPAPEVRQGGQLEEIVVTASRIATTGYTQPTPVTVVGEAVLQREAKVSIGDTIRDLPAVGASSSPNNGAGAGNIVSAITGLDTVNLRQLGINRTLVLFDGQRVVQSNITGGVDLGTVPTALVQRVDVVTGGASAAWGSDAVAGVVNLILNKKFEGVRASVEGGDSFKWDHTSYRLQFAGGRSFADGKGHVIFAANYLNSPEVVFPGQRSWYTRTQLVNNPAYTATNGQPRLIHAQNVGLSQATQGGLITGGPLKGLQFVGPNATLAPFNFGNVSGPLSNGGDAETTHPDINDLTVDYHTSTLFGYGSYEITDNIRASVQLNYGTTWSRNNSVPAVRLGNLTIQRDNAFLPAEARNRMIAAGVTSIPLGTTNMNNLDPNNLSLDNFEDALGIPVNVTKRALKRGVFSLDGKFGSNWTWNAYYQHGEVEVDLNLRSNVITANYNLAIDAVVDPVSQKIVCRSTLTNPNNGCVPLNIFGTGVASKAAIDYVNTRNDFEVIKLKQDVAAWSTQGTLPFGFSPGNVAVAFGGEYRKEAGTVVTDPGAAARLYSVGNFSPFNGEYDVKEGFLEVEAPVLKDNIVQSLTLNAAGRITDYSTSGVVKTWKLGATSQLNDDIRLRGTISRDIRAPNLAELFNSGTSTLGQAIDPRSGASVSIFTVASGNPDLVPEEAKTFSGGVVITPRWLPRFNLSVDYYSIDIKKAIFAVNANQVLARCNAGETVYCPQLVFAPVGPDKTPTLTEIHTFPLNVSSQETSGLDFQLDYSHPLFNGDLGFRLVGNYVLTQSQLALGTKIDYAGSISPDSAVSGFPRFRSTASVSYNQGPFSGTVQGRFIGKAELNKAWTKLDVDDNSVPAVFYVDLRGSYQLTNALQFFVAVDNLLNLDPPVVAASPATGQQAYYFTAVRGDIYDTLGRSYRAGVRLKF